MATNADRAREILLKTVYQSRDSRTGTRDNRKKVKVKQRQPKIFRKLRTLKKERYYA